MDRAGYICNIAISNVSVYLVTIANLHALSRKLDFELLDNATFCKVLVQCQFKNFSVLYN